MNAAEKARLAKEAQKKEKEAKRENFRGALASHIVLIVIAVVILALVGVGFLVVPKIVDSCKAAYDRTHATVDGVVYKLSDGRYTAESLEKGVTEAIIRGEINDLPVSGVKRNFAKKSTALKTLTIETENEMEIAKMAFYKCTALQEITITGSGKVTILPNAFSKCTMLKHLTVRDAAVKGDQYLFDGDAPALTVTLENGTLTDLYDTVKRVEISGGSSFSATIVGSGMIAGECVLLGDIRSEDKVGAFGFGFLAKPHLIAPLYYISADVTKIPDNFFGTEKEASKLSVYYGGTEAQWNALIATADHSTNRYFFDLLGNGKVTVHYGTSYEEFNNRR